jgi:hypothetical protein
MKEWFFGGKIKKKAPETLTFVYNCDFENFCGDEYKLKDKKQN